MRQLYSHQEKIQTDLLKKQFKMKNLTEKLRNQSKRLESLLKKHQIEYERIKDKEIVDENDIELDQLLVSYK